MITEKQEKYLKSLVEDNVFGKNLEPSKNNTDFLIKRIYLSKLELPKTKEEASKWIELLKGSFGFVEVIEMVGGYEEFHNELMNIFGSEKNFRNDIRPFYLDSVSEVNPNKAFLEKVNEILESGKRPVHQRQKRIFDLLGEKVESYDEAAGKLRSWGIGEKGKIDGYKASQIDDMSDDELKQVLLENIK